jgi:radical SAM protein
MAGVTPSVIRAPRYDVAKRPFIVIWEVTRACALACLHCRAEAIADRDPGELSSEEAVDLMTQVASFGIPPPLFVLTGGDPFERDDLETVIAAGRRLGLPVSVSPSGTPALTPANLARIHRAGALAMSLSVDGASAGVHDGFRGVPGVFDQTLAAWRAAREIGLKVQINTTVTPATVEELPGIFSLVRDIGAMTWSVFLLVPVGRGSALGQLDPVEVEDILHFLYDADKVVSVKATEAHHFRRVALQRHVLESRGLDHVEVLGLGERYRSLRAEAERRLGPMGERRGVRRAPLEVAAARGFVFISHTGDVYPSGFLPIAAGNVRDTPLPELYRSSPLFRSVRRTDALTGRCGRCEYATVCGGSRARAFATTGDLFAEEPLCSYEPGSFPFAQDVAGLRSR